MGDRPPIWELSAAGAGREDSSWSREKRDYARPKLEYQLMSQEEKEALIAQMKKQYKNEFFTTDQVEKSFHLVTASFLIDLATSGVLEKREPGEYPDKTVKIPPYTFRFKPGKESK